MTTPLRDGDPAQIGPYRIHARLGGGGMGQVFLGRSPGGRTVAVKIVRSDLADDAGFRRRFADEVKAARKVGGFYTAPVVDADPDGNPPWLATAYIPGPTLHQAVADHGPLPMESVAVLGAGLAEGLDAIHAQNVVHRDLKPANVILTSDGPRLIDFGIARALDATSHTRTSTVLGTAAFMSPEQATVQTVGSASDVFSLGCCARVRVLAFEREMLGLCVSAHPLDGAEHVLDANRDTTIAGLLASGRQDGVVRVSGIVSGLQRKVTKQGSPWAIVTLEDHDAAVERLVFPKSYTLYDEALAEDRVLAVRGRINVRDETTSVYAEEVTVLDLARADTDHPPVVISIQETQLTARVVREFRHVLSTHPGRAPVHVRLHRTGAVSVLLNLRPSTSRRSRRSTATSRRCSAPSRSARHDGQARRERRGGRRGVPALRHR
ncbi:protein kinase [Nonomuraea muscovyensis]|uniref:serine/threonine-protein kinase n=1 Tax=Nonomuraea muscovyensis TaxID=1124761 RepID=UPI0033E45C67